MLKYFLLILTLTTCIVAEGLCQSDKISRLKEQLVETTKNDTSKVDLLNNLGQTYWVFQPDSSEYYGKKGLELSQGLNYVGGKAFANRVIGVAHWARGNYEGGLKHLLSSLKFYQQISDSVGMANATMNLGLIYYAQGDTERALNNYLNAYNTFEKYDRKRRLINTANHIGRAYFALMEYPKAKEFYSFALDLSEEDNYNYGAGTALHNLGVLYKSNQKLDSAMLYCKASMEYQNIQKDREGLASNYETLGDIYFEKEDYINAISTYEEGLTMAKLVSSKKIQSNIYTKLKETYTKLGDYKKALAFQEDYTVLQDSLMSLDKMRSMVWLESKNELALKNQKLTIQEQKIALLKREQQLKNIWLIVFALGLLILSIAGIGIYLSQKAKHEKEKELLENKQALMAIKHENDRLKKEELQKELDYKNKELTSYTINFIKKNELMEDLKSKISTIKKEAPMTMGKELNSVLRLVDSNFRLDKDWEDFRLMFEQVHQDFFSNLKAKYPELTQNELKLCALLKLNMNLKESANILGIAPESVKTARYRLRKKLMLGKEENLVDYIIQS